MRGLHPSTDTTASATVTTPISVLPLPWKMIVIEGLEIDFPYSDFRRTYYHVLYHKCSSVFTHYAHSTPHRPPLASQPASACLALGSAISREAPKLLFSLVFSLLSRMSALSSYHLPLTCLSAFYVLGQQDHACWGRAFSVVSSLLTKSTSSWLANLSCVMIAAPLR